MHKPPARPTCRLTVCALLLSVPLSLTAAPARSKGTEPTRATSSLSPQSTCEDWKIVPGDEALLYPDVSATYTVQKFEWDPGMVLRVTAEFGHDRFESYTLYEDLGGSRVNKLADREIVPDEGSTNPFLVGSDRDATARSHTVYIASPESAFASAPNVLLVDLEAGTPLTLMKRIYVPDEGQDSLGGVALPGIEALDATTGEPMACPKNQNKWFIVTDADETVVPDLESDLHFFRVAGNSVYPSFDTAYLAAGLDMSFGPVAVVRFKAPLFPDTSEGSDFTEGEEVRYFSMCLSRLLSTKTETCVPDYRFPDLGDGYRYAVVTRADSEVQAAAASMGLGVLVLPYGLRFPLLIYRNLFVDDDFHYGTTSVPPYDQSLPPEQQYAENYIEDYAPIGWFCSRRDFLKNACSIRLE